MKTIRLLPQAQLDSRRSKMASFEKAKKSYQKFHRERGQVRVNVMEEYLFMSESNAGQSISLELGNIVEK